MRGVGVPRPQAKGQVLFLPTTALMSRTRSPLLDDTTEALFGHGARFNRAALVCREALHRVWTDPVLGPRYRRIVILQAIWVVLFAAALLAMGIGIRKVSSEAPSFARLFALMASAWGALLAGHWGVIALSYRFHDVLTREASLLLGVHPEDPEVVPRVRLDFGWVGKRIKRRIRGFMVMVPGFFAFWVLSLVTGRTLSALLGALWVAHWWIVFSLAKTARAWPEPAIAYPWYVRGWDALARVAPLLDVGPFRWWRNYLASSSTSVWSPLSWTERLPAEGSALALMRLTANVPGLGMAVRPLVPLCAALMIEHGDGALDHLRTHPRPAQPPAAFPSSDLRARTPEPTPPEPPVEL